MSELLKQRDRNVIPRWRDFRSTAHLGELDSVKPEPGPQSVGDLNVLLVDWQEHKTVSFAGDLISAAVVSGNPGAAREAAQFVLTLGDAVSPGLRGLAERVTSGKTTPSLADLEPLSLTPDLARRPSAAILSTRHRLIDHPADAILWMDLGYLYAIRGLHEKSERAIRIALNLAPSNRFVVRSASRFFIHRDRPDIAHDVLLRSPALKRDPWLVSAEIAVAMSAARAPSTAYRGVTLSSSGDFSTHQLSELRSALGTLELRSGDVRKARRLVRQSLEAPTDNSLAQAEWLSRNLSGLDVSVTGARPQIPRPYEAQAYVAFAKYDWDDAFGHTLQWLIDQPFSTRPARLAAYIASTIQENFDVSEQTARFGLIANPNDPGLRISLAYSFAKRNMLEEAVAELAKIPTDHNEQGIDAAVNANLGLIAFRRRETESARTFYGQSVRKADDLKDKSVKFGALMNWIFEELNLTDNWVPRLLEEAKTASKHALSLEVPYLMQRIEQRVSERAATNILP
jgi:Flp pilus assembly protein TadD